MEAQQHLDEDVIFTSSEMVHSYLELGITVHPVTWQHHTDVTWAAQLK